MTKSSDQQMTERLTDEQARMLTARGLEIAYQIEAGTYSLKTPELKMEPGWYTRPQAF